MIVKGDKPLRTTYASGNFRDGVGLHTWASELGFVQILNGDHVFMIHGLEPNIFESNWEDIFDYEIHE